MMRLVDRRLFVAAYALGLGAVSVLSLMPYGVDVGDVPQGDKLAHFAAYGLVALAGGLGGARRGPAIGLALVAVLCGLGLEAAQDFVPGRHASGWDALANAAGALAGLAAALALLARGPAWLRRRLAA
ncbi:MAG: VanZ family protein [Alphaproteobacteria bacterium]